MSAWLLADCLARQPRSITSASGVPDTLLTG